MIELLKADITTLHVDAIVNAANSGLRGGGGVDGAIHRAAGPGMMAELRAHDGCPTGSAVITGGHALPARYVIHAVGPVWRDGAHGEPELLASAYETSFELASRAGDVRSIAFPAISTGVYGYPLDAATEIALGVMREHEREFDRIVACVFDDGALGVYEETLRRLRASA